MKLKGMNIIKQKTKQKNTNKLQFRGKIKKIKIKKCEWGTKMS